MNDEILTKDGFVEERIEEIKDSSKLQMKSLCAFMNALGYTYCRGEFLGSSYSGAPVVKFNTAVRLYQLDWYHVDGKFVPYYHANVLNSPFEFDWYTLKKALSTKIIERVKLQSNRYGKITCQCHKVEFKDRYLAELFEGELV